MDKCGLNMGEQRLPKQVEDDYGLDVRVEIVAGEDVSGLRSPLPITSSTVPSR